MTSSSVAEKGDAHVEQASTTTATTVSISAQTELTAFEQAPEPQIVKWRLVSLYVSICLGLFLSFIDTSIVATAIFIIGVEFHSLSKIKWIALAYTLAYIGCTAIFASLSDFFGRRNAYIAAAVIFLAFSLGCGFAQSLDQLIAMRALQGVGGSGLYSVGFVILPEISSLRMLKMIGALAGAVIAISGTLDPVLGGIITNYTTWRWIFWINAPIGVVPLILFIVAWPESSQLQRVERHTFKQIDFLGFFLLIASGWNPRRLERFDMEFGSLRLSPLVIGVVCYFALFGWEWFIARRWPNTIAALFPVCLAKSRVYMSAVIATTLTGFPYFVVIYSLPTRFQVVNGHSALASGIALLPMLGASAIGSTVAGAASSKRNNTFPIMIVGAVFMLVGTASLSTLENVVATQARAYGLQAFVGFGFGFGFGLTVSNSSLIAGLEAEFRDTAVAQGIIALVRMLGGSIGIAASTAILGVKQRQQLLDTAPLNLVQLQSLADSMPHLSPAQNFAIRQAYTDAFNETLVVCSVISGVALLATAGGWQKHPVTMEDRRRQQSQSEAARQRQLGEVRARAAAMQAAQEVK